MNELAAGGPRPTVLVVDDDPESVLLVTTMVEYCGYAARQALDFGAAVEALAEGPAAVVLDVVMPNAESERLLALIANGGRALPIVLMSALSAEALATRAEAARAGGVNVVAWLAKPFWVEPLISALEKAIPDPAAIGGADAIG